MLDVYPGMKETQSTMLSSLKKGVEYIGHYQIYYNARGQAVDYQHTTAPLYASDGGMVGVIEIGRNMSGVRRLQEQVVELNQLLYADHHEKHHAIITENPEMLRRLAIIKNYAGTDATILINGESGTGKEVLAQSIHNASQRVNGPFVAINCGAMAPQILESELFGYVAGAFTGASPKGKIGLFELAHHGTIFLDEISELDKPLQTRLLRVLQERQIMRLGSDQMIPVDIRVIAATNQTLTKLIADGTFREDLYYRLNVLKVTTIPLRKRPEDIKAIGLSLLTSFSQHYKRPALTLTPALWQELQRFAWPGNVRQLSNIIERLVLSIDHSPATLDEGRLLLDDLEEGSRREPTTCHDCQMLAGDYKTIRLRILRKLLEAERDNKSLVAKRLNVDRTSLTRWIRESA